MPIEMRCNGCGQTLRVGDEHAGKQARCPACGTIQQVPLPEASAVPGAAVEAAPLASPFAGSPAPAAKPNPFADRDDMAANPYASPSAVSYVPRLGPAYGPPHRGGAVLGLGIASICLIMFGFCCGLLALAALPLGITAWVMGAGDLRSMREGQMDPSGQGLTVAGMVMGIVTTALCGVALLLVFLGFAFHVARFGL